MEDKDLTLDSATNLENTNYKLSDFANPDVRKQFDTSLMTMSDAIRMQSINADTFNRIKDSISTNKSQTSITGTLKEAGKTAVRGFTDIPSDAIDAFKTLFKDSDWTFPDMTPEQRDNMAVAIAMRQRAKKSQREFEREQSGAMNPVTDILSTIADTVGKVGVGIATAGTATIPIAIAEGLRVGSGGVLGAAEKEVERKGTLKDFDTKTVGALQSVNAGIQGYIENKLGVHTKIFDAVVQDAMKRGVKKKIAEAAFEEGSEEFLQELTGAFFDSGAMGVGENYEDRTWGEVFEDAVVNGVAGALIGGVIGGANYKYQRGKLASNIQNFSDAYGLDMDNATATSIADDIMFGIKNATVEEITTISELSNHYGASYNTLVDMIKDVYNADHLSFSDELVQGQARKVANDVIFNAQGFNMPVGEYLETFVRDNLSVKNGIIFTRKFDNAEQMLADYKQQKKILQKQVNVDNTARIRELQNRIKTLENYIGIAESNKKINRMRQRRQAAQVDLNDFTRSNPQVAKELKSIQQANYTDNMDTFTYVGGIRVPTNYEVVSAKTINQSHINGEVNPNYSNKALQNRARANIVDSAVLQNRATNFQPEKMLKSADATTGAPIVNEQGDVISGNGRTDTLARAKTANPQAYELYKQRLQELGYNIDGIEDPILVRRVSGLSESQQVAVAEASNFKPISEFQHAAQAVNDGKSLTANKIMNPQELFANLPNEEKQAYVNTDGSIDQLALDRRFNDAVMARILGTENFENLVLGGRLNQKVVQGISSSVKNGLFVVADANPEFSILEDLSSAVMKSAITTKNNFLDTVWQSDLAVKNPAITNAMLYELVQDTQNGISNFLSDYASRSVEHKDQKNGLFKDSIGVLSQTDIARQSLIEIAKEAGKVDENGVIKDDANLRAVFVPTEATADNTIEEQQQQDLLFQSDIEDKNLVVQHETTLKKLQDALDLGAMPMPSLAITKSEYSGEGQYGEITFIGNERMVNPLVSKDNRIFEADIYSTRKVSPVYEITDEGKNFINDIAEKGKSKQGKYYWTQRVVEDFDRGMDTALKELYLANTGAIKDLDGRIYDIVSNMSEEDKANFDSWKREVEKKYTTKRIFKGYTPSGSRRYVDYNIKNIFDIMSKEKLKGAESGMGGTAHSLRGVLSPELKTIEDIKKKKNKIVDEATYKEMDNALWDATSKLSDILVSETKAEELKRSFISPDEYMIEEALSLLKPNSNIKNVLAKAGLNNDAKAVNAVKDYIRLITELPVKYFEAKPQRIVDFSEFSGVVMPTSPKYDQVAKELSDKGLKVVRSDEDNRNDVINKEFSDVFFQGRSSRYNGYFDKQLGTIVLGSNANEGTLLHETSHFFLEENFKTWKDGTAPKKWQEKFDQIANILGITKDQDELTTEQQENWAYMTEAYLFGKGTPEGRLPFVTEFLKWAPAQYQTIEDIGYRDAEGNIHNPVLTKEAMDVMDRLYSNGWLTDSPQILDFTNEINSSGKIIPVNVEREKERMKQLDNPVEEPVSAQYNLKDMAMSAGQVIEETKTELWNEVTEEREATRPEEKPTFVQRVFAGRGTNTQAQMQADAQKWIKDNPVYAKQLLEDSLLSEFTDGTWHNDSGIDPTSLLLTYAEMNKGSLSPEKYNEIVLKAEVQRSIASKSAGLTNFHKSMFLDGYNQVLKNKNQKVALARYGKVDNAVELLNKDIQDTANKWATKLSNTEQGSIERQQVVAEMLADIKEQFGIEDIDGDVLYQEDLNSLRNISKSRKQHFVNKIKGVIRKHAGLEMTTAEQNALTTKAREAQKAIDTGMLDSKDLDTVKLGAKKLYEYQTELDKYSIKPTATSNFVGAWMPRATLSRPSTHIVNIASNTFQMLSMRATNRAFFGANMVDKGVIDQARQRYKAIFEETGINMAQIAKTGDKTLIGGEYAPQKGADNKWYDTFGWLAAEDNFFRNDAFFDYLAHRASQVARKNGQGVEEANRLFGEYVKVNNNEPEILKIREEAVNAGHIAVFTNDTKFAQAMTKIKRAVDDITAIRFNTKQGLYLEKGGKGLGTILMPFVKTPANVIYLGAEMLANPVYNLATLNFSKFATDWNLQRDSIALGMSAMIVAALMSAGEYKPSKSKYDDGDVVIIGGMKFKLNALGPMAQPVRQLMTIWNGMQGKNKGINDWINTGLSELPAFGALSDFETLADNPIRFATNTAGGIVGQTIPGIVQTGFKIAGDFGALPYGQTSDKMLKPFVRPFGGARSKNRLQDTTDAMYYLLFGNYVKKNK